MYKERQEILKLKGIDGKRTETMCSIGKNKQITTRSIIIKMKERIRQGTDSTSHIQTGKELAVRDR